MAGTSEGGKKAAEHRSQESLSKAGQAGAAARHAKSSEQESQVAKKAADTRKQHDTNNFSKMGEKGGHASRSKSSDDS